MFSKPQYKINLIRTAYQALAAVLGGAQSLHTNGLDEAFTIPTEEAMKLSLRTQQIIADETNVTAVIDPLGGSYYVEQLTDEMEKKIMEILDKVDKMGGTLKAVEENWFQKEIADSAYAAALEKAQGQKIVIGVNKYVDEEEQMDITTHPYDQQTEIRQIANLNRMRETRDEAQVFHLLTQLKAVAQDDTQNLMPITIDLVKAGASMGEIVESLRSLWGSYQETPVF